MPASLSDINNLRTILGRLNAERPAGLGGSTGETPYQEREGDFLRRLDLEVTSRQGKARVLVTGQIGVGKSSELRHFYQLKRRKEASAFWVHCDLESEEHPERCGATGVLLAVFRDCWGATKNLRDESYRSPRRPSHAFQEFNKIRDEILIRLIEWLKGEYGDDKKGVDFQFGGMLFPVFLEEKNRALAMILGKAAKHEAVSKPSDRFGLAPDSLVNLLNRLLNWLAERKDGRSPVLIIDHVDKIRDGAAAHEVLLEIVPEWNRIDASIVMTAPYEYTLGELRNSVEANWGRPLMVYPVEMPELDSAQVPSIYWDITKAAGLRSLIDDESLTILSHYSGGVLRTFVQFLIQSCKEAHLAGHRSIEPSDARVVVSDYERSYQDFGSRHLDLLDEIDRKGTGLGEATVLLRSPIALLVTEPRGEEQQIRVHPSARAALERHRLKKERALA